MADDKWFGNQIRKAFHIVHDHFGLDCEITDEDLKAYKKIAFQEILRYLLNH